MADVVAADARQPDFLIIGAPKCGTTWLTKRLARHPQVCMPDDEVHYFSRFHDRGPDWYAAHFSGGRAGQLRGENSNSYLTEPAALPRMRAGASNAKLICILRDPIDRAYSSYGMQIDRGRATRDIARYLDPDRSPRPHILANGRYGELLEPIVAAYGRDRLLVLRFDDIRRDPAGLYARTLAFLGLDPGFVPEGLSERENVRKTSGIPGPVKRTLWWARPILDRPALRRLRDGAIGRRLIGAISRRKSYPPLTPAIEAGLAAYYAPDVARLETLLGERFDAWHVHRKA